MNTCTRIITDKNCNIIVLDNTFDENFIQVYILKFKDQTEVFVKSAETQTVTFSYSQDGFYTLCKVTIPLDTSKPIYYKLGKYYYNNQEISLKDLIKLSEVDAEYSYFFSTCNLKKCFVKVCQEIFNSKNTICSQGNVDHSLIYKRDLIWSALNVIQYMAEMDQMDEAQRLLEEITSCNGLCPSSSQSNSGCGCGK